MKKVFHEFITVLLVTMSILLINNSGIKPLKSELPKDIVDEIAYQRTDEYKRDIIATPPNGSRIFRDPIFLKPIYLGHGKIKVDINTATIDELIRLKGIGKSTAKKIIVFRNQHGAFSSIDELTKIKGIGKKKLKQIIDNN